MNHPEQKKWFVYITDHHEGPFSILEVQEKLSGGAISEKNYVWAEGMADWVPFTAVPELGQLVKPKAQPVFATFSSDKGEDTSTTLQIQPVSLDSVIFEPQNDEAAPSPAPEPATLEPTTLEPTTLEPMTLEPATLEPMSLEPTLLSEAPSLEPQLAEPLESKPQDVPAVKSSDHEPTLTQFTLSTPESTALETPAPIDEAVAPKKKKVSKLLFLIVILVLGAGGWTLSRGVLSPLFSAFRGTFAPYLGRWISPIPKLEDVEPEEYEQLKEAAVSASTPSGLKVAIAFSKENALTPKFYVASDVADGVRYEIQLEANSDTLLNQFAYSAKTTVQIKEKFGASEPIKTQTGLVVPRGDYTVAVVDPESKKVLARKNYFLGGPRDAAYLERLNDFHERVKRKAQDELTELAQFADTLTAQLGRTQTRFSADKAFQGKKSKLKGWSESSQDWKKFQSQFEAGIQKWTPENLENDLFYGAIYRLVPEAIQAVGRLHQVQDQYLYASENLPALDAEILQIATQAQNAIEALKKKIEQAKALPLSGKGMPRRDGL